MLARCLMLLVFMTAPETSEPGRPLSAASDAEIPPPVLPLEFTPPSEPSDAQPSDAEAPNPNTSPPPNKGGAAGFSMMGGGPGGGPPGYSAVWYPSRPASPSGQDFSLVRQQLNIGAPLWADDGRRLMLNAGVRHVAFFTDVLFPDSGQPFPGELWNVNLGANYHHRFANGWSGSVGVNFGSASDKPFHSIDEMFVSFLGFVRIPTRNERDAWLVSLMYSPVGNFNFPIPGLAYSWNPNPQWSANIGLPFFLTYKPNDDWTLSLSYIPVTNVSARATVRLHERLHAFGGFEWLYEAYFLADRDIDRERFIAFEKRLLAGVRWDIAPKASWDVNAGYAFDRDYGFGENQLGDLSNQVTISNGPFLGTQLRMRF